MSMDQQYGPLLPSEYNGRRGRRNKTSSTSNINDNINRQATTSALELSHSTVISDPDSMQCSSSIGQQAVIGPILPDQLKARYTVCSNETSECKRIEEESEFIGPSALEVSHSTVISDPDSMQCSSSIGQQALIGPILPDQLKARYTVCSNETSECKDIEEESEFIGPMPDNNITCSRITASAHDIEERSRKMKRKLLNEEDENEQAETMKQRESWMIDLPPDSVLAGGVIARTFRTKVPPKNTDRSCWTDTPADRCRKQMEGVKKDVCKNSVDATEHARMEKDKQYASQVADYNDTIRPKSLMELHSEKLAGNTKCKEKKKKSKKKKHKSDDREEKRKKNKHRKKSKSGERTDDNKSKPIQEATRRPFDRDIDLKTSSINALDKQSLVKRSQQLSGRFGHGSTQFL